MERAPSETPETPAPHAETISPTRLDARLLARMLDAVEQAIIATDREGRILYWNRFAEMLYGWSASEVLGRHVLDVTPAEGARAAAAEIMERLRAGASWTGEFQVQRKDGVSFPARVTNAPIFDEQETLIGIVGASVDISEQKRAEAALRESEDGLRFALDAGGLGRWDWDLRTNRVQWVEGPSRPLGWYGAQNHLQFEEFVALIHPDDRPRVLGEIDAAIRGERPYDTEFRQKRPEGGFFWKLSRGQVVRDAAGNPTRMVGIAADITRLKEAEQALAERVRLLALMADVGRVVTRGDALRAILPACVEALPRRLDVALAAIWMLDEEVLELQAEAGPGPEAMAALRSIPVGECLIGRVARERQPAVITEAAPELCPPLREWALNERVTAIAGYPLAVEGRVYGVLAVASREPLTEATAAALRSVADEIALGIDRKQVEEAREQALQRQQALSQRLVEVQEEERRRLARELHDEVGQLLVRQEMLLRLAVEEALPPGEARRHLKDALALTAELTARVRRLSLDLRPAMLDDLGLLPALLWYFERYTQQTGVHVSFAHSGLERRFPSEVENAAYRIVQEALTNVARHAGVKAVTVRGWETGEMVGVQVEDHGAGFDPEATLAAGFSSGLGGMRERVALIGGRLTVESRPGEGTRLTAEFPLPDP